MARTAERYAVVGITHDKRSGDIYANIYAIFKYREQAEYLANSYSFMNRDDEFRQEKIQVVAASYFDK